MNLSSMYHAADEHGECSAEIESGVYVEDLKVEVMTAGYIFKTDGRSFSVVKNKRQPINYAKTGTV